ncbi:MAG: cell wall-active antibiotics response protein [Treponema sp.]|nr:cell wall-active antibiotics response protein [Treponema sp.]
MKTDMSAEQLSPREMKLIARKNKAVDRLSVQFSKNAMSLEEYERLIDYIQKAESERELTIIEKIVGESAAYSGMENDKSYGRKTPQRHEHSPSYSPLNGILGSEWSDITFMSSREISGASLVGKRRSFLSFLGNTSIIIEEGQLPQGKTVVNAVSFLGNIVITVPSSVKVTMEANAILGNTTIDRGTGITEALHANVPELVVTGGAFMGNLAVEIRKPRGGF